ncbi:MAG TPA: serine protease [Verrucomicrobiae bacterium]|nr:serine protease [Verrucomicrobiae bacterium]
MLLALNTLAAGLAGSTHAADPRTFGTGFAVRADGWILTSAQVVAGARSLAVTCPGRPKATATLDHFVRRLDIAILRMEQEGLPYLTFSLSISVSEMVLVGDNVATVVYLKSTDGTIAATPAIATVTALAGPGDSPEFLQLAMPADRRDAGAPVVSARGDVVGILTSAAAIKDFVDPAAPPSSGVTWAVKGQAVLRLFVPPPPIDPTRSLEDATERTRRATCLVEVTR